MERTITFELRTTERMAVAAAIESAISATHKVINGDTGRYYDEDAGTTVTYDRVDPVVVHASIVVSEGLCALHRMLCAAPLQHEKRAGAYGVTIEKDGDVALVSFDRQHAAVNANLLSLALQYAVLRAAPIQTHGYEHGTPQYEAIVEMERAQRQKQRAVLERMIGGLTPF